MQARILASLVFIWLFQSYMFGQTAGMILKPAGAPGNTVLDPDGDGYVSQKTNGVQMGFTIPPDNDVANSEIPFVPIVRPDPTGDLLRGPVGAFSEIVGTDAAGNNAIMVYNDGTNLLFRFRLSGYAPNSKSYSIMIDTDQKFGFTGVNADPNAIPGNAGFEVEIVLRTNFSVDAYNVDGTTSGTLVTTYPYETNCQKALAVSNAGGDDDYFYDFYLPLSGLSSVGITASTPLRFVATTVMNPNPGVGNNALSDIGGITTKSSPDAIFTELVDSQTPTTTGNINSGGVLDRSACPAINPVSVSSTTITGTSSEAAGTLIKVYVYQSNGSTLIGSGTTLVAAGSWSINVSALNPAVILAVGQVVKATATAAEKGASYDNCSLKTVSNCTSATSNVGVVLTKISGSKGYTVANTFPTGTIITWYNSDFTPANYVTKSGGSTYIQNPQTTTAPSQTISFSTETGQTFPAGVFYFTFQEPGKCVSSFMYDCQYSVDGTSVVPVITTPVITTNTVSISGTCGSSAETMVSLFADGVFLKSTRVVSSSSWTISGLNLSSYGCAVITASASDAGKCPSTTASGVTVSRVALKPSFSSSGCSSSSPVAAISGYSTEADGSTVTLFKTNPSRSPVGTATVSGGSWTASSLSLLAGDNIVAAVTAGTCLLQGPDSDPVTIAIKTNIGGYTISINTPTEGQSAVTGTISGGTYPVTLRVYADQSQIGDAIVINAAGSWSVGSLLSTDLYPGATINVTLTGTGCESDFSNASAIVQCIPPAVPSAVGGSYTYCYGGAGSINLTTSQSGVIYQLINNSGVAQGPSYMGNGSPIKLTTFALTSDLTNILVKAFKVGLNSCFVTSSANINFTPQTTTPSITFSSTSVSVQKGNTSVNLPFTAKSGSPSADTYTIDFSVAAKAQGFLNVSTPVAVPAAPGNISIAVPAGAAPGNYPGTLTVKETSGSTCDGNYSFTITVYGPSSPPVISTQPMNKAICSGNTAVLGVAAAGSGTVTYQWQSANSYFGTYSNVTEGTGATSASYTTAGLTATKYYRVVVSNASGSVISNVATVTVNKTPALSGSINGDGNLCSGQSLNYSVVPSPEATSYSWSYNGSNTIINGTSDAVSLNFAPDATSGVLKVHGNNACGSGDDLTYSITVNPAPFINNMTGSACSGTAFSITPLDGANGFVPSGTTYSWGVPVVTGGMTGGASGTGEAIVGTLVNTTSSAQTATYTATPVKGSCPGNNFTVIISVNPTINITTTPVNLLCNGASTGRVGITVSGGTPGYTYAWTGPGGFTSTAPNISGLAAGVYNLAVTDSKSCTANGSATVNQPAAITITPTITAPTCNGGATGAISLSVTGGTGSMSYLWNDGISTQDRTNLTAGNYSVTVTDGNGCTKSSGVIAVSEPAAISALAAASSIDCYGGTSTITVTATGGTGTLNYNLNGALFQAGNAFEGISASSSPYNIVVKDGNGCTKTANVTVTQPPALALSSVITKEECPGKANGAIDLTISGGTPSYNKNWTDVTGTDNDEDRTGLTAGSYTITVTDSKGCTAINTITISVLNPAPVVPGTITK